MTILTDAPRQHDYLGNGATTAYAYTFLIFAASDLLVSQDDVLLTLNTHYTVSGVGQFTGGTVTMVIPPPDGSALAIRSDVPITQGTSFPEGYRFPGRTVEATLDRLTVLARQLKDRLRLGLFSASTATVMDLVLPPPEAGKVLGWNATADGLENTDQAPQGLQGIQGIQGLTGAGSAPTITDGVTSVVNPTFLEFLLASGFTVTNPSAGVARINFVPVSIPPGLLAPYAGGIIPTGWLPWNGAAVSRTTYAALFAALGVVWGAGDGTTTFNVGPGAGRFVLGAGVGAGLTPRSLGATGGEETHVLTVAELPSHRHGLPLTAPSNSSAGGAEFPIAGTGALTDFAGSDGAHNTMPPWFAAQWIVKT